MTYVFVAVTLVILYVVPRFIKSIPAPLIAIVVLTAVAIFSGVEFKNSWRFRSYYTIFTLFLIPNVPFTFETLAIIFPYSISLSHCRFVGKPINSFDCR